MHSYIYSKIKFYPKQDSTKSEVINILSQDLNTKKIYFNKVKDFSEFDTEIMSRCLKLYLKLIEKDIQLYDGKQLFPFERYAKLNNHFIQFTKPKKGDFK